MIRENRPKAREDIRALEAQFLIIEQVLPRRHCLSAGCPSEALPPFQWREALTDGKPGLHPPRNQRLSHRRTEGAPSGIPYAFALKRIRPETTNQVVARTGNGSGTDPPHRLRKTLATAEHWSPKASRNTRGYRNACSKQDQHAQRKQPQAGEGQPR